MRNRPTEPSRVKFRPDDGVSLRAMLVPPAQWVVDSIENVLDVDVHALWGIDDPHRDRQTIRAEPAPDHLSGERVVASFHRHKQLVVDRTRACGQVTFD